MAKRLAVKSADELSQVGLRYHRSGDRAQAERSYLAALERDSRHVVSLSLLSALLMERAEYARAAAFLARALSIAPDAAILHSNLGEAWRRLGRRSEAVSAFRRAVQLNPDLAEAHHNLGLALDQLGRLTEAISAYEAALKLRPGLDGAAKLLLAALRDAGDYERAISWFRRLTRQGNDSAELRCSIAAVLTDVFRIDEAIEHLERALELAPRLAPAHAGLATALAELGEIDQAVARLRTALELEPDNALYRSNLVYLLQLSGVAGPSEVYAAAAEFGRLHTNHVVRTSLEAPIAARQRRLRIGYVSPDFRNHPVALFLLPLFRNHDRASVEIFCYSNVRRPDSVTAEIRCLADQWSDISSLDDDDAARLIRDDRIDVLVDLTQHGAGHRLSVFARKPAAVQVSWLGYPGPTGVAAIDYRLTDSTLDPRPTADASSSEELVWLPETYWCYAPSSEQPVVSELPASTNGHVTFGCLNSFKKVSDVSLALWSRVLRAVPDSRLLLVAPEGRARRRVNEFMSGCGVEPSRLTFVGHVPRLQYLERYAELDIALDPAPYAGGTTTMDAFWMGVPVVTLLGATAVGRGGASIARSLRLPDLVAKTHDEYVERARVLASQRDDLAALRRELRPRMRDSVLMDASRFARDLEAAYAWMLSQRDIPVRDAL